MLLSRRPKSPAVPHDRGGETLQAIGQELRDARIARGEDLHDIAAFLRIRPAYLVALERGELGALPGWPYAAGFLRCYGGHLGLDGDALVARLKPAAAGMALPREIGRREPPSESRRPTAAVVTASLVLASALYAGYHLFSADREPPAEQVAELAGGVQPPAASPVQSSEAAAPTVTAAEATVSPTAVPVRDEDAPTIQPAETAPPAAADVTSAVAAESSSSDAAAVGAPAVLAALDGATPPAAAAAGGDAAGRVVLVARGTSWIQVRSADRAYVRTRTLQPGDRFVVPERPDLTLSTGNAGGLEVLVDGVSVGLVGASGAVVRNLPLVPEALKVRPVAAR